MSDILTLQEKLVHNAWPSGYEQSMGKFLLDLVSPLVDEAWIDRMGNVICHKKGPGKKVMFPAHMDVLGLVILDVDEKGYGIFDTNGGFSGENLTSTAFIFESGVRGAVRAQGKANANDKGIGDVNDKCDLYIDIGAKNREEALRYMPIGCCAKYATRPFMLRNNIMATPYADDLACCNVLIQALEKLQGKKLQNDAWFVFTVQEEIGLRGAGAAAYAIEPDVCVVLDGTYTVGSLSDHGKVGTTAGGGAAIKVRDSSLVCNKQVVEYLTRLAKENNIPHQMELMIGGGTDGEAVQKSKTGVLTSGISLPMGNIHSPYETVDLGDVEACAELIAAVCMNEYK